MASMWPGLELKTQSMEVKGKIDKSKRNRLSEREIDEIMDKSFNNRMSIQASPQQESEEFKSFD